MSNQQQNEPNPNLVGAAWWANPLNGGEPYLSIKINKAIPEVCKLNAIKNLRKTEEETTKPDFLVYLKEDSFGSPPPQQGTSQQAQSQNRPAGGQYGQNPQGNSPNRPAQGGFQNNQQRGPSRGNSGW